VRAEVLERDSAANKAMHNGSHKDYSKPAKDHSK